VLFHSAFRFGLRIRLVQFSCFITNWLFLLLIFLGLIFLGSLSRLWTWIVSPMERGFSANERQLIIARWSWPYTRPGLDDISICKYQASTWLHVSIRPARPGLSSGYLSMGATTLQNIYGFFQLLASIWSLYMGVAYAALAAMWYAYMRQRAKLLIDIYDNKWY